MTDDVMLFCGDCAQVMREHLADGSIDLTVTSPPYDNLRTYKGFTFDFEAIAAQLWRVTKPGGVVVWVVADATINGSETGTSFRQALHFMSLGFNLHDTMIWQKINYAPLTHNRYDPCFEFMFVLSHGSPKTFNPLLIHTAAKWTKNYATALQNRIEKQSAVRYRDERRQSKEYKYRGNLWEYRRGRRSAENEHDHTAPFPEALARDHILSWSNPGDLVLDPMMGSGTTGKEAIKTGRCFIGIDIAAEYVELARKRIGRAQLQPRLLSVASEHEGHDFTQSALPL